LHTIQDDEHFAAGKSSTSTTTVMLRAKDKLAGNLQFQLS
jgi:hypothetical protein